MLWLLLMFQFFIWNFYRSSFFREREQAWRVVSIHYERAKFVPTQKVEIVQETWNLILFDVITYLYSGAPSKMVNGNHASVAGKLQQHAQFSENTLHAPPFVMTIVKEGYSLPFESLPPSFLTRNKKSSLEKKYFVTELLQNKCIRAVEHPPYSVNPLTVASRNSKLRFVLDLRGSVV